MTVETANSINTRELSPLIQSSLITLTIISGLVCGASICLMYTSNLSWCFPLFSITAYLLSGVFVLANLRDYPHRRFGPANAVTAIRSGITCLIAGTLFEAEQLTNTTIAWGVVSAAVLALLLDGVDGYLARRSSTNSDFGARYDMEVDAALILCLSVLVYLSGKADWWVILIGSMRYLFIVAQHFDARLQGELTPAWRRQVICVLQVICLGIILIPSIEASVSSLIAGLSLVMLSYSFGRDIVSLLRQPTPR
ncbi:CDP-alcohol phosphatidyltransferase family protein [Phyllobacterium sp. YR531]|uniref:CDP-alcohol phosphatidyltransferase family protein n=1 Tax=Phyllobacterium sp. YR531 TaxID=1144343 RepID=UPI00026FA18B|nr:CDP-alcohol phosphatidyltransferase family protein [Phyllobacterium sp. YR531]EJN02234.1 phosphatidylglycerophosphate synthase [Phyllobacterium sp. YR531]